MDSITHTDACEDVDRPASPIDLQGLYSRCLGNFDLAERVLASFENRFAEDLDALHSACSRRDAVRVREIAHRMKGASANAGATALMSESASVEQLAEFGKLEDVSHRLMELGREWDRFCSVDKGRSGRRSPS